MKAGFFLWGVGWGGRGGKLWRQRLSVIETLPVVIQLPVVSKISVESGNFCCQIFLVHFDGSHKYKIGYSLCKTSHYWVATHSFPFG